MEFRFNYSVRPENLWFLSLHTLYRSMAGFVNIIFTVSMVLLAVRFWSGAPLAVKLALSAGILLFPVFQPLFIFLRSRRIVSRMPGNLEMSINSQGIVISSNESRSLIGFHDLTSVVQHRRMLIITTKSTHAYILGEQTLEGKGQSLFDFLRENMSK